MRALLSSRKARFSLAALVVFVPLAFFFDLFGLLFPPSPEYLLGKMRENWNRMDGYRAQVIHGVWQSAPIGSEQWVRPDGTVVMMAKDAYGMNHLERWTDDGQWQYFQPGAGFEASIDVKNLDAVPFGRWAVSGYLTVGDVVEVLNHGKDFKVGRPTSLGKSKTWPLEFTPVVPDQALPQDYPFRSASEGFHQALFTRTWRVWLSQQTGLPVRAYVFGVPGEIRGYAIDVHEFEPGPLALPDDWMEVFKGDRTIKRRFALRCDAGSPSEVEATQEKLRGEVDVWRRTLFSGKPIRDGR